MAGRVQTSDLARPPELRPVASPVGTYFRPGAGTAERDGPNSELAGLATALSEIQPSINRYLEAEHKEYSEDEIKKGMAARLENQKAFKDAIAAGLIPEGASPWFIKGYNQQHGRILGMEYDTAVRTEWSKNGDVQNSDDPKALQAFMADNRKAFMEQHGVSQNPDVLDGFLPSVSRAETNLSAQHIAHRQQEISKKTRENLGVEVGKIIDTYAEIEAAEQFAIDPRARNEQMGSQISAIVSGLVRNGLSGTDANKIVKDTILAKAYELRDPDLADVADHVTTGSGKLSGISGVGQEIVQLKRTLANWSYDETVKSWAIQDREHNLKMKAWAEERIPYEREQMQRAKQNADRAEEARALRSVLSIAISADPAMPLSHPSLKGDMAKLYAIDPTQADAVTHLRSFLLTEREKFVMTDDKRAWMANLAREMYLRKETFNPNRIFNGVTSGMIDTSHMMSLLDDWRRVKDEGDTNPALKDQEVKYLLNRLETQVAVDPEGKITGSSQINATNAVVATRDAVKAEFARTNDINAARDMARKKVEELTKHYAPDAAAGAKPTPGAKTESSTSAPKVPVQKRDSVADSQAIGKLQELAQTHTDLEGRLKSIKESNVEWVGTGPISLPTRREDAIRNLEAQIKRTEEDQKNLEEALKKGSGEKPAKDKKQEYPKPTSAHIEALRADPLGLYKAYDEKFGKGAAKRDLKGK